MASYDVNPAGVKSALDLTVADAAEFATIVQPLDGAVESAATATGPSAPIVGALTELFTAEQTRMKGIGARVKACVTGAAAATNAYNQADQEMADSTKANAQQGAAARFQATAVADAAKQPR